MNPRMNRYVAALENIEACRRNVEYVAERGEQSAIADARGILHNAKEYAERVCREWPDGTYTLTEDVPLKTPGQATVVWLQGQNARLVTHENPNGADVRQLRNLVTRHSVIDIELHFNPIFVALEPADPVGVPSDYATDPKNILDMLLKMHALTQDQIVFAVSECERERQGWHHS